MNDDEKIIAKMENSNIEEKSIEEMTTEAETKYNTALDTLNKNIEDFSNTEFELSGGLETAKYLLAFIEQRAKWTYTEAKIVVLVVDKLKQQIKDIESGKMDNLKLFSRELEAINYFFSKHESIGYKSAEGFYKYVDIVLSALKPTGDFKEYLKKEDNNIKILEYKYNSLKMGMIPPPETDLGLK